MKRGFLFAAVAAALPAAAFEASKHDKIIRTDDSVIEGRIAVDNPKEEFIWIVPVGSGIKTPVKRKEIKMVIPRKTRQEAYKEASGKINPGDAHERIRLAEECLSKRMYEEAKTELVKLLGETPDHWQAMLRLSEVELTLGPADAAYRHALGACDIKPGSADTQAQAGKAAAAAGQHEKAIAHFENSLAAEDRPETRVWYGISQAELGLLVEAEKNLRGALEANPDNVYAHLGMGRLALAQCSLVEAVAALKQAAELVEGARLARAKASQLRADIHRALGSTLYLSGEFSDAEEELRLALNEEPDSPAAFATLGLCGILSGKGKRGIDSLRQANLKTEASGRAHVGLAYIFDVRGELELALDEYDKAVSASPRDAYSWYMRGDANYRAGVGAADPMEAEGCFRAGAKSFARAAALAPRFIGALRGAGAAALAVADVEGARRWFEKAAGLLPDDPDVQAGLGLVDLAGGELAEAERKLRGVLEAHPDNAQAMLGLGYMANSQARDMEAERLFLKALGDKSAAGYAISALEKLCEGRGLEFVHLDFNAPPLPGDWTVLATYGIAVEVSDGKLSFSGRQQKLRGGRTALLRAVTSTGFSRIECRLEALTETFGGGLFLQGPGAEIACGVDETGKLGYRLRDRTGTKPWTALGNWPRDSAVRLVIEPVERGQGSFRLLLGKHEVGPFEIQALKRQPRYTVGVYTKADVRVDVQMLVDDLILIAGE